MNIQIRKSSEKDVEDLINLVRIYDEFYDNKRNDTERREFVEILAKDLKKGLQLIAWVDKIPVGFASLSFTLSLLKGEHILVLNEIFEHPDYKGLNIGKSLFLACQEYAIENAVADFIWMSNAENFAEKVLYDKITKKEKELSFYNV